MLNSCPNLIFQQATITILIAINNVVLDINILWKKKRTFHDSEYYYHEDFVIGKQNLVIIVDDCTYCNM